MSQTTDPTETAPDGPGVYPAHEDPVAPADTPTGSADVAPAADAGGWADSGPIVAKGSNDYRVRRYIMVALVAGFGLYFLYDGYVGYPEHNREVAAVQQSQQEANDRGDAAEEARLSAELLKLGEAKTPLDILTQKILGFTLPPLALAFLVWTLYNSRGEYRLEGDELHVPGHPRVPLDRVTGVDREKWERKGIAHVDYALAGGQTGRLRLDDFVYQQKPTDAIYDRVGAYADQSGAPAPSPGKPGEGA